MKRWQFRRCAKVLLSAHIRSALNTQEGVDEQVAARCGAVRRLLREQRHAKLTLEASRQLTYADRRVRSGGLTVIRGVTYFGVCGVIFFKSTQLLFQDFGETKMKLEIERNDFKQKNSILEKLGA